MNDTEHKSYAGKNETWAQRGLLLAHRLRRWPSSEPRWAHVSCLRGCGLVHFHLAKYPSKHEMLKQCWFNVGPVSETMAHH